MRGRIAPREAAAEIRSASKAALENAPALAQAHATAAMLHFWYEWDWRKAEESYRRAIALNPSEVGALHDHGWLLITRGNREEGLAQIRRAQELDPVSPRANAHVAWAYIYTGHYDLAIAEARRALELSPEFEEAYWCLEEAYMLSGRYDAALDARQKRLAMMGEPPAVTKDARAFLIGDRVRAAERMDAAQRERNPYRAAVGFALAGNNDRAIEWLERAKDQGSVNMPLAGVDPKLRSLHGDPRFARLLRDIRYHAGP
jgi:tetratricopeptide (TPR) repeat protein